MSLLKSDKNVSEQDRELLEKLYDIINGEETPALFVGREGAHFELPEAVFHVFAEIIRKMHMGESITVLSEKEELTTQAAANHLGVSRPYFVKLLEDGQIPFRRVGTHRRVYLRDLMAYSRVRDAERKEALSNLTRRIEGAGLYDSDYTGEA